MVTYQGFCALNDLPGTSQALASAHLPRCVSVHRGSGERHRARLPTYPEFEVRCCTAAAVLLYKCRCSATGQCAALVCCTATHNAHVLPASNPVAPAQGYPLEALEGVEEGEVSGLNRAVAAAEEEQAAARFKRDLLFNLGLVGAAMFQAFLMEFRVTHSAWPMGALHKHLAPGGSHQAAKTATFPPLARSVGSACMTRPSAAWRPTCGRTPSSRPSYCTTSHRTAVQVGRGSWADGVYCGWCWGFCTVADVR